jgi:hypothetical protein
MSRTVKLRKIRHLEVHTKLLSKKTVVKRALGKNIEVDGMIILKQLPQKYCVRLLTEAVYLNTLHTHTRFITAMIYHVIKGVNTSLTSCKADKYTRTSLLHI